MNVISAVFSNPQGTVVKVDYGTGKDAYVPWPCENRHKQFINRWIAAGNSIGPYSDPNPKPAPNLFHDIATVVGLINDRHSRALSAVEIAELNQSIATLKALANGKSQL